MIAFKGVGILDWNERIENLSYRSSGTRSDLDLEQNGIQSKSSTFAEMEETDCIGGCAVGLVVQGTKR